MNGVELLALEDVAEADGRWLARSGAPWLAAPGLERMSGGWLRLRYHAGLFDELVRPLIRFRRVGGGEEIVPMNGALTGVAEWIGRVPARTVAVAISPVRREGPFSFAVVGAWRIGSDRLLLRGLRRHPRMALTALGARLIGSREEARHCLKFAALATPMAHYARWTRRRTRTIDLAGFDRPHHGAGEGPTIHFLMTGPDEPAAFERTLASLQAQSRPDWTLLPLDDRARNPRASDTRVRRVAGTLPLDGLGTAGDLVATISAGDMILPHACALVVDAMRSHADAKVCYGDEEDGGADGWPASPRLKPDFGPFFHASTDYIGGGAFVRITALTEAGAKTLGEAAARPLDTSSPRAIMHLRRPLFRRPYAAPPIAPPSPPVPAEPPAVAVIVPTRDRPELLRACLASLRERTEYPSLHLVIVDNGTTDEGALALLAEAAARPRVTVLREPGPFNYSALCNRGAAAATAPVLAFLNNDVTALGADWLHRLAGWAMRPDIGAVGPKLLFPDGRVQHGGDVLGLGETALHAYRLAANGPGYLGQLGAVREVAAVTGAVQVVERAKFVAVGGFDAEAFPILLNDTDLCLRLAARGWISLYDPLAAMVHAESSSRGYSVRPFTLYGRERRNFTARWQRAIRDDPFFHPALSLYAETPALG